jgi:maltose alpha-D-glucosyltransferase/alpha-amylase
VFDREMLPTIRVTGGVEKVLSGEPRRGLEEVVLPGYMRMSRWFGSKAKKIRSVRIAESIPFDSAGAFGALLLLDVAYTTGEQERYCLPVSYAGEQLADAIREESPQTIIGVVESGTDGTSGILYDSSADSAFHRALFLLMAGKGRIRGARGMLRGRRGDSGLAAIDTDEKVPPSHLLKAEQSNTSIRFGESYFLKIYRKLDRGTNPEVELLGFLTSKTRFRHAPGYAGSIEFRSGSAEPTSVAIMQSFVRADGEAWGYFRDAAGHYFDHLLEQRPEEELEHALPSLLEAGPDRIPEPLSRRVGDKPLRLAALLGQRTAELHRALGSRRDVPLFAPEPLDRSYLGGLYRSMDALAGRALDALATRRTHLPPSVQEPARAVLARRDDIRARLKAVTNITGGGMRIRIHGDYHLGQVLRIGNDFIIMDFEGEPARPVRERKEKYPPFKDVAGMVRSFHYAAYGNLLLGRGVRSADVALLERWAGPWYICTAGAFLRGYLDTIGAESIVPKGARQRRALLDVFLLEKSVYELLYELNNRPAWSAIPMKGIVNILSSYEGKVIV